MYRFCTPQRLRVLALCAAVSGAHGITFQHNEVARDDADLDQIPTFFGARADGTVNRPGEKEVKKPAKTSTGGTEAPPAEGDFYAQHQIAAKLYFQLLGNWSSEHDLIVGSTPGGLSCALEKGCVDPWVMRRFLAGKWIPGRQLVREDKSLPKEVKEDVVSGRFFPRRIKHTLHAAQPLESLMADFVHYVRTRPREAVPLEIRKLLLPPNKTDDTWLGSTMPRSFFKPSRIQSKRNPDGLIEQDNAPYAALKNSQCNLKCRMKALAETGLPEYQHEPPELSNLEDSLSLRRMESRRTQVRWSDATLFITFATLIPYLAWQYHLRRISPPPEEPLKWTPYDRYGRFPWNSPKGDLV